MKRKVIIYAISKEERILGRYLRDHLLSERRFSREEISLTKQEIEEEPAIALAICDYHCLLNKCLRRFVLLSQMQQSLIALARPLHAGKGILGNSYFLINLLRQPKISQHNDCGLLHNIISSSQSVLSPSWPIHPSKQLYKVAMTQKVVVEFDDKAISLSSAAKAVNWTPSWLSSEFKIYAGINFEQFQVKIKMCKVLWQLIVTDKTIKTLSYEIGYKDPLYLSKLIKERFGISGTAIRTMLAV